MTDTAALRELLAAATDGKGNIHTIAARRTLGDSMADWLPALLDEIERLRGGMRAIAEGDEPRPVGHAWRTDGKPSKHDRCAHGLSMWQHCGNCVSDFARAFLESGHE